MDEKFQDRLKRLQDNAEKGGDEMFFDPKSAKAYMDDNPIFAEDIARQARAKKALAKHQTVRRQGRKRFGLPRVPLPDSPLVFLLLLVGFGIFLALILQGIVTGSAEWLVVAGIFVLVVVFGIIYANARIWLRTEFPWIYPVLVLIGVVGAYLGLSSGKSSGAPVEMTATETAPNGLSMLVDTGPLAPQTSKELYDKVRFSDNDPAMSEEEAAVLVTIMAKVQKPEGDSQ